MADPSNKGSGKPPQIAWGQHGGMYSLRDGSPDGGNAPQIAWGAEGGNESIPDKNDPQEEGGSSDASGKPPVIEWGSQGGATTIAQKTAESGGAEGEKIERRTTYSGV
jgi:hypothetical protein